MDARRARPVLVLLSGICALVLSMGIARFAYTPILPYMQAGTGMGDALAGWLAGWNYLGYLLGVLFVSTLKDLSVKDRLYRLGLLLGVVTTGMMALSDSTVVWGVSRFLAGLSAAAGLLLGSGLIMNWLLRNGQSGELGVHFSGAGLGIVVGGLVVAVTAPILDWRGQWWALTAVAAVLLLPALRWLPHPTTSRPLTRQQVERVREPGKLWLALLQVAYCCAGFGYVVSATFTVLIVEQQPALAGRGVLVWLVVGLAAIPAPILWDRIARRTGYLRALRWAFALQIVGILLPVATGSLAGALASAVLFGGTFIGIVSLVLTMVGLFYPAHPARIMARLTLGFSIAQVVGPVMAGEAAAATGSFDGSLIMAGAIMGAGFACLALMSGQATQPVGTAGHREGLKDGSII